VLTHRFNRKKASMAAALCYGVRGGGAQLCFHVQAGSYDTDTLIQVLGELRRFLGGEKATLLWDGLPAHRSRAMQTWLNTQRRWLVVERLPAYAPELNPTEGLWSWLKGSQLATWSARPCGRWWSRPSWASNAPGGRHSSPTHSFAGPGSRSHDRSGHPLGSVRTALRPTRLTSDP
jgi:transposase